MSKKSIPTIRSVAKLAGVSTATVSYVLNDGPRSVNEATRNRVLQAIQELEYQPNTAARNLANRRTNTLGLVVAGLSESSFSRSSFFEYVRGISWAAESADYNLLLFGSHNRAKQARFYQQIARSRAVDGLVLLGSSIPDEEIAELHDQGFPSVLLGRALLEGSSYSVQEDYRQGAYEATRHLIGGGYHRIGFLGQALRYSYGVERLEGYKQALRENGIPYDPGITSIPDLARDDPSEEEIGILLSRDVPPDAILTDRGMCVLQTLRALGRRVPGDVALINLDEDENSRFSDPPLTFLRAPLFELGAAAAKTVIDLIHGDTPMAKTLVLPVELIHRDSCPRRE